MVHLIEFGHKVCDKGKKVFHPRGFHLKEFDHWGNDLTGHWSLLALIPQAIDPDPKALILGRFISGGLIPGALIPNVWIPVAWIQQGIDP